MRHGLISTFCIGAALALSGCGGGTSTAEVERAVKDVNVIDETNLNDIMLTVADPNEAVAYFKRAASEQPDRLDLQRAIAERWAQRLERDGGNAVAGRVVIQPATVSGQDLFRVRVTGLESQQQARGIAATLEARYGLARLWVGRSERG